MDCLTCLFRETYFKDVIERNKIAKIQELEDLIDILAPWWAPSQTRPR